MSKDDVKLSIGFLYDDTLDSNNGVAQYVKTLGAWLSVQGHGVSYLVGETKLPDWRGGKIYSLAKNLNVRFNGNRLSMPVLSSSASIRRVLETKKFDILHVQMPYSPFMSQRVIKRAGRNTGVVATFHILPSGVLSAIGSRLLRLIQWRSLRRLERVISVGPAAADFAKRNFGIESTVIPNLIDLSSFRPHDSENAGNQKIVFLGRLVKRKGCEPLIRAFDVLARSRPNVDLIIAGDGPERAKLERLANKLDLSKKVSFLGFIEEDKKPDLLAGAAIACFPSLGGESFGIVLLEAMAAGAGIVLAGDNPGYRTVMQDRPKLLIDPKNTRLMAERMAELLDDKELASELQAWQARHVKQYDVNVVGVQILAIYRQVIAKKAANSHNIPHAAR